MISNPEQIIPIEKPKRDYVSYSAIKDWKFCPFYYKLMRIDKIEEFKDSIHTAFGKAVHSTCEKIFKQEKEDSFDYKADFSENFRKELRSLSKETKVNLKDKDMIVFNEQGKILVDLVLPATKKYIGYFEFVSAEEELFEEIDERDDYKFKGFIDLVLKSNDGIYHIIDFKTCSWGWDAERKSDTMTTYQLTYYKNYYAQKYGIPFDRIKTHFGLLKRTAKKDQVEYFEVKNGEKKAKNALKLLEEHIINVDRNNFIKNKTKCSECRVKGSKWCP